MNWRDRLRDFLYGMSGYEFSRHALEMRAALETVFMATTMGNIVGVPVMPPYYALRLLPYAVPEMDRWKRRVLREREFTEEHDNDLHGL